MRRQSTSPFSLSRPWRNLALLGAAALVAAGAVAIALSSGGDGTTPTGGSGTSAVGVLDPHRPQVGEKAPDFALYDVRDGATLRRLSDYRGKVVILNWYASWCGPCAAEIPDFEQLYRESGGEIVVFGINLQESREKAAGMLASLGATYPAVLDSRGEVARHYRVSGMPTTYIIDADGIVRAFTAGQVTRQALLDKLDELGLQ